MSQTDKFPLQDCANLFTDTCDLYGQCLKHGFDTATAFFAWNGFQAADLSNTLLVGCLRALVERVELDVTPGGNNVVARLLEKTVRYLGWKFLSCSHFQEFCQQANWLLMGYTRVNNQSGARTAS